MISKDEQMRTVVAEQAADWFAANDEGPLNEAESAALIAWLRASPIHVEEFLGVSVVARDLREAAADPERSLDALVARARADDETPMQPFWARTVASSGALTPARWQPAAVAMATLGVMCIALVLWWQLGPAGGTSAPTDATELHFATRHGEQQTHRLADHSVLHLDTDTAVTIRYSRIQRVVMLTSGQAEFEVAHEPNRAFRVLAGPAEVVDLGTRFDVRVDHDSTVVTVIEGRVAVARAPMPGNTGTSSKQEQAPRFVQLGADEQITVTAAEGPTSPKAVDAQRATDWLHRQIAFDHEPLERVAAEFNRYAPKPIDIVTPALRKLQITGVFATDDPEEFIAFLRSLEGVHVEVTATRILVSQN